MKKSARISMNNKFQTLLGGKGLAPNPSAILVFKHPQLKIGFAVPALLSIKTVF